MTIACRSSMMILAAMGLILTRPASGTILWGDLGATLVHESGSGSSFLTGSAMDVLGGTVKRDDSSGGTLYFKFHVDPLSDKNTEEYFAAFELFEGDTERLAVGNSLKAWAYSAFNTFDTGENNKVFGDVDLHSARPESIAPGKDYGYELPSRGVECTIVFKVQYVPHGDDLVTVWLNPDLSPGATEQSQPEALTTRFKANATFNEIHLRHGGGGGGWTFSDMAIATSFNDFVAASGGKPGEVTFDTSTFVSWQREQGLPQNFIRALAQTRDGYLWIGSDEGIARFDGVRFTSFGLPEGLRNSRVTALLGDHRGWLWIGTAGGLTQLQNGQFTTVTDHNSQPTDPVTALAEDDLGRVWVGTDSGLVIWQNGNLAELAGAGIFKGKSVTALFKDQAGHMWVGAAGAGVFDFNGSEFTPVPGNESINELLQDPHCLLVDRARRLWIGAGDDFILCHDGNEWRRYRITRHLARPYVCSLAEQPDGALWAASVSEGLFEFKDGKEISLRADSGLPDNFIESLLVDQEGKLWVGTDAGLNHLRQKSLFAFGQKAGLGDGTVEGLTEISPGKIWVGKPDDGIYEWNGKEFSRVKPTNFFTPYFKVNSLLTLRDGSCWAATGQGLLHFKHPAADPDDVSSLPGVWHVTALCEDHIDGIWAGTREGTVLHIARNGLLITTNFSESRPITVIAQDTDRTLWIGTAGSGVYRVLADGTRSRFAKFSGLVTDKIRTLYLDSTHTVWIGTDGGGLSRWKNGVITTFSTHEGLPDNTVSQIVEDDSGYLWLGGTRGLAQVSKQDLEDVANGKATVVYPQTFGRSEGMLSEECSGGFGPAGLKTQSGQLWFATAKGVVVVNPRSQSTRIPPPKTLLEDVQVDNLPGIEFEEQNPAGEPPANTNNEGTVLGKLQIPPGRHSLELRYTGLSFSAPEQIRFRYRLAGLDTDWVEAGTRRVASYNYVPPGRYKFSVIACNNDGVWSSPTTSLVLNVSPHWWQASWALSLSVVALLFAVGSIVRVTEKRKTNRKLKLLEQERAVARERARIAQDLHDELGSSLARISLLSGLVKSDKDLPAQVETHADKLSQSAGQTVRALEEIVWAVRPGSDSLQSLMDYIAHFASELFEGTATRCRLDLPHELPALPLPPDVRHNIFLVVKEALANVLKHASAKEVHVQAKITGNILEISVQDDGAGFDAPETKIEGRQHGLTNMQQRAEALGGTLHRQAAAGKGATIKLTVPLPKPLVVK